MGATTQVMGFKEKRYDQYRDRRTGRFIKRDYAKTLPPSRVIEEQRRILLPRLVEIPAAAA